MRQTLYLHIGYHKTGTTSVQSFCNQHRAHLAKAGLCYPLTERGGPLPSYHKHLYVGRPLLEMPESEAADPEAVAAIFQPYLSEIAASGCPAGLISTEEFSLLPPERIAALGFLRDRFDVRVIAFLRSQGRYLAALYSERVREDGETRPFAGYLEDDWWNIDYFAYLNRWADVFGAENMIVRSYDRVSMEASGTLIAGFLSLMGVEAAAVPADDRRWHPTFPPVCTEILRRLQLSGASPEDLTAFKSKCVTDVPWLRLKERDPLFRRPLMSADQTRDLCVRYAESNRLCAERFHDGVPLFPEHGPGGGPEADVPVETGFSEQDLLLATTRILLSSKPKPGSKS